ncbi:hypothetical protein D3C87_2032240 [compost metagenome]
MPTGFRFAGASRDLAPLYSPKWCFGRIWPVTPTKASAQNGVASLKITLTVRLSIFSTLMSL